MKSQEKRKCLHDYFTIMALNSFIHNNPKLEATQIFIRSSMDEKIVEYLYNGILLKKNKLIKKIPQMTWMNF